MLIKQLLELAHEILNLQREEDDIRNILTDTDLKGREVITMICETEALDLLSHKFVEKLADEVWDGPARVERSLMWYSTSWLAL